MLTPEELLLWGAQYLDANLAIISFNHDFVNDCLFVGVLAEILDDWFETKEHLTFVCEKISGNPVKEVSVFLTDNGFKQRSLAKKLIGGTLPHTSGEEIC